MTIGFIGLGVMGEPMCRNLARKGIKPVIAYDLQREPLERLSAHGVATAADVAEVAAKSSIVFLSLPSGKHVEKVCRGAGGLLEHCRAGQIVVDLGTTSVVLTRELAEAFRAKGVDYADAPIARTRQAAEDGTLSIMVGAEETVFAALKPRLSFLATEVTHCGSIGNGQIAKIMNNMVLVQTVVALAEALATARRAGMDGGVLFDVLSKGSADSFALRNHGMKALLPGNFPERAFSTAYALKDISYAQELAQEVGLTLEGAGLAAEMLKRTIDAGHGDLYWPVLGRILEQ